VIEKVSEVMDGVEDELLAGFDPTEREELEGLLTAMWEGTGGYEEYARAEAVVEDEADAA
jgi:hypothetical protein